MKGSSASFAKSIAQFGFEGADVAGQRRLCDQQSCRSAPEVQCVAFVVGAQSLVAIFALLFWRAPTTGGIDNMPARSVHVARSTR